ncbi:ABC transporter substrate-binding protein [Geminicoccus roseus]|uniref:ABC transporter substrate-binding protein n=1 Tax=Geminicoccus roseus TaxID=404900 RepID=UPI0004257145|nr:ABC transporter substrate-binding protein [Geminicoccus roseus]
MARLTSLLSAATVAACLALPASAGAATAIDFFFPVPVDGKLAKEMQRLVKLFNEEHPEIQVTPAYTGNYDETKIKAQAAAAAGKPPAVVLMSANFVYELALQDQILPLDPMIEADGTSKDAFMEDFWPALHKNAEFNGHVWAVPYHNSTPLLYYNTDHFQEVGLDPDQPPVTWQDWVDAAKKLTVRDGDQVERYGLTMSGSYDMLGWTMSALTMSNGGLYYNPDWGGEVYYDTPSMLGALTLWDDLIHKHKVTPEGVVDNKGVSSSFLAGQTSMVILSTGSLSFIRENMEGHYKVAFVPKNVRNAVAIGGASLVMFKGATEEQQQAGWTFANWLTTPENLGSWSRFTGYFAPRQSSYALPEMQQFLDENPDAAVALDQLRFAQPWFATYNTVAVRKALEDEVQAVLSGTKKPKEALEAAQANADAIMKPFVDSTALALPN